MAATRIYLVAGERLVRAQNRSQALKHVASEITVEVVGQDKLIELVQGGAKVEDAGKEADPEEL